MKKTFWIMLLLCIAMPLIVYAADGTDCDINGDGHVDEEDLIFFAESFGISAGYGDGDEADYDMDEDGDVDATDLAFFAEYFGKFCWYKDADGDKYSDGIKVWSVSRPFPYFYLAEELLSLWGDTDDGNADIIPVWEGDYFINNLSALEIISGYVKITGNLAIQSDLTSLSGLENLTSIDGALHLEHNAGLTSLAGLDHLTSVGGDLGISYNAALTSLIGLEKITSLDGDLYIANNNALTGLSGLDNLISVGGGLDVSFNGDLNSLAGLEKLTSVSGQLTISSNSSLPSLAGLEELTTVHGLMIYNNSVLASLSALDSLSLVSGNLQILANDLLSSLAGLEGIISVGGQMAINGNTKLTNLSGLENLTSVGSIGISGNDALTNLSSLYNLTSVGGSLGILGNSNLTCLGLDRLCSVDGNFNISDNSSLCSNVASKLRDQVAGCPGGGIGSTITIANNNTCGAWRSDFTVDGPTDIAILSGYSHVAGDLIISNPTTPVTSLLGIEGLFSVGGDLYIQNNPALTSLSGLDNLTSVGGMNIVSNASLTSLSGLENLVSVDDGGMNISSNASLTSLSDLENLTTVGGYLYIGNNASLTSLSGLENLTSVSANLYIDENAALPDIDGLSNLSSVGQDLFISNNAILASLAGLENLTTVGGDLNIFTNTVLPTCVAEWLRDNIGVDNIGGAIDFHDNCDACICMAHIPAGCFNMGDHFGESLENEIPVHTVCLTTDFKMDVHEVTNAKYAACVDDGVCTAPSNTTKYNNSAYDDHPVTYVDWYQATDYCTWAGKRLPTDAEWEYAARGGLSGKRYPWGGDSLDYSDDISGTNANYKDSGDPWDNDTSPAKYYAANGYGLYDMAGNVWEWVSDWYQWYYYTVSPTNDPKGPASGTFHVVRGGAWSSNDTISLRVSKRSSSSPSNSNSGLGFRCAW